MSLLICIRIAFLLPAAESPFQMGVLVLALSVVSAVILRAVTSWLALILFLMYVGGILVTFAYLLALCPNQVIGIRPIMVVPLLLGVGLLQDMRVSPVVTGVEVRDIYDYQNLVVLIMLGLVLLFAMVSVVKIVSRPLGALRPLT